MLRPLSATSARAPVRRAERTELAGSSDQLICSAVNTPSHQLTAWPTDRLCVDRLTRQSSADWGARIPSQRRQTDKTTEYTVIIMISATIL